MKLSISEKQIAEDLLICAMEGGSNYWYQWDNSESDGTPYWEQAFTDKGIVITNGAHRVNDPNDPLVETVVNGAKITATLKLMQKEWPNAWADAINDGDAETGDVFLQLAVFGRLVYG